MVRCGARRTPAGPLEYGEIWEIWGRYGEIWRTPAGPLEVDEADGAALVQQQICRLRVAVDESAEAACRVAAGAASAGGNVVERVGLGRGVARHALQPLPERLKPLGIDAGELLRRVEARPEPLRVLRVLCGEAVELRRLWDMSRTCLGHVMDVS